MRNRWRFTLFIAAALAASPAAAQAQNDTGMKTETQERLAAATVPKASRKACVSTNARIGWRSGRRA